MFRQEDRICRKLQDNQKGFEQKGFFDRMTGFAEFFRQERQMAFGTEFTELIELERSRFIICLSAGISGSSFFE
jgi:hypothetical protein